MSTTSDDDPLVGYAGFTISPDGQTMRHKVWWSRGALEPGQLMVFTMCDTMFRVARKDAGRLIDETPAICLECLASDKPSFQYLEAALKAINGTLIEKEKVADVVQQAFDDWSKEQGVVPFPALDAQLDPTTGAVRVTCRIDAVREVRVTITID